MDISNKDTNLIGRIEVTMKKILSILIILLMGLLLGACDKDDEDSIGKTVVDIYYIDSKTSGMVSESYELISDITDEQIDEVLYMLKKGPENLVYKSALPENVTVLDFALNSDNSLTINFDTTYSELTGIPEILCRAAIVKTLSQIRGVDYIQINVNGSPLIDSNGDVVGPLRSEDFIVDTEANTSYRLKLYFANKDGDGLVEYDMDVNYTGSSSLEELAIELLINGPTQRGMYDTIPEGTVLLNVTKSDGICTVDFNEKYLESIPGVTDEVTIYSVVNTLVELPNINKVQFTINSKVVKTFRENTSFDVTFERNLNLIEEAK